MATRILPEASMMLLRVDVTIMLREYGSLAIDFISLNSDTDRSATTVIRRVPSTRRSRAAAATYRT